MADVAYIPDGNNQANNVLPWMLAAGNNGFGGFGGGAGWGSLLAGGIGGLFAGALFPGLFGGNRWGYGNGNGAADAAGYVSNQLNNDSGRQMIIQAIAGNTSALHDIATTIGQDFNLVQAGINGLSSSLASVGSSVGMSALQVVNAIQNGNAELASRFAQCCCENKLLTVEQGYQAQIRTLEQTNTLGSQADRNTRSITDAIAGQTIAMNDQFCKLQNREYEAEISRLKTELANAARAADKAEIIGSVSAMLTPIAGQVASIKQSMPPTVSVPYPQLTAIQTAPGVEFLTNAAVLASLLRNFLGNGTDTGAATTNS